MELLKEVEMRSLSDLEVFARETAEMLATHNLPDSLTSDLYVIADELLSNLFKHGGGTLLRFRFYCHAKELEVLCQYNGAPFNPLAQQRPDMDRPIEERPIGGLGLELIMALTDKQQYHYDGAFNQLALTLTFS